MQTCIQCGVVLTGRQRKYCSRRCKNRSTNFRHQSYLAQQKRGLERKRELVRLEGCQCRLCGYNRNLAALEFHHTKPSTKTFPLDLRSLSNRSWKTLREEARKCVLLCSNCHKETHHPQMSLKKKSRAEPGFSDYVSKDD